MFLSFSLRCAVDSCLVGLLSLLCAYSAQAQIISVTIDAVDTTSVTFTAEVIATNSPDSFYLLVKKDISSPPIGSVFAFPSDTTGLLTVTVDSLNAGLNYSAFAVLGMWSTGITSQVLGESFATLGIANIAPPSISNVVVAAQRVGFTDSIIVTINGRFEAPSNNEGAAPWPFIKEEPLDTFFPANTSSSPLWAYLGTDLNFSFDVYDVLAGRNYTFQFKVYSQDTVFHWDVPITLDTFDILSSISETKGGSDVTLFPNPVGDKLTVRVPNGGGEGLIIITAMHGAEVIRKVVSGSEIALDVSTLALGQYIFHIETQERSYVQQFIKQ